VRRKTGAVGFLREHRRSCATWILQTSEISIEEYDGLSLYQPVHVFGLARGGGRRRRSFAGSSNASIDGHKGPTLDWWAAKCSVGTVSPKTTRTDAIRRPIKAIGMVDTTGVLSINMRGLSDNPPPPPQFRETEPTV
jgi:hypothetical protein